MNADGSSLARGAFRYVRGSRTEWPPCGVSIRRVLPRFDAAATFASALLRGPFARRRRLTGLRAARNRQAACRD